MGAINTIYVDADDRSYHRTCIYISIIREMLIGVYIHDTYTL